MDSAWSWQGSGRARCGPTARDAFQSVVLLVAVWSSFSLSAADGRKVWAAYAEACAAGDLVVGPFGCWQFVRGPVQIRTEGDADPAGPRQGRILLAPLVAPCWRSGAWAVIPPLEAAGGVVIPTNVGSLYLFAHPRWACLRNQ